MIVLSAGTMFDIQRVKQISSVDECCLTKNEFCLRLLLHEAIDCCSDTSNKRASDCDLQKAIATEGMNGASMMGLTQERRNCCPGPFAVHWMKIGAYCLPSNLLSHYPESRTVEELTQLIIRLPQTKAFSWHFPKRVKVWPKVSNCFHTTYQKQMEPTPSPNWSLEIVLCIATET